MDKIELNEAQKKSRRGRNIALGLALAALAVVFYAITVAKYFNVAAG